VLLSCGAMLDVTRQRVSLHSDHSPWIILLDLVILLAQHGVIYFIHIIVIIIIVFGHTVQGVLDSDLIYIRYFTLILFWVIPHVGIIQ
jgi:hypothetical protein